MSKYEANRAFSANGLPVAGVEIEDGKLKIELEVEIPEGATLESVTSKLGAAASFCSGCDGVWSGFSSFIS